MKDDLRALIARWGALPPRVRLTAAGGVVVLVLGLGFLIFGGGRPCGVREDVEARVAALAALNQASAASGEITVSQLAERTKALNAAATAFETTKDLSAYCAALDEFAGKFEKPF